MTQPTAQELKDIKAAALITVGRYAARDTMLKRYREIYFMTGVDQPRNEEIDPNDWKITPSPSGRNEVVGMQRLLNTSELQIDIKDEAKKEKIEEGLKAILRVSGEGRRARVESDAALSVVLYGAVCVYAEAIQDLLTIKTLSPAKRRHLEKKQKRSPFLLRLINTEESYPEWDEDMLISHVWKYRLLGKFLKSRWGVKGYTDNTEYIVYDVMTPEYHVVWAEGSKENIFVGEHGLGCVPIFVAYAGGSDLFTKPEEQMNSFLYAKAKGNFDKRENSLLTTLFTNIHQRGTAGPLIAIDPENAGQTVTVSYAGGMRYIMAKATQVDDKIIDPVIFQAKSVLDELSGQSTVYRQTLGENVGAGNMPFSSMAMLSNSGKLPLIDPQRALEQVFTDAFNHILYRIKNEVIENEQIKPEDIEDDTEIECSLTAKLPQDSLRNAQIAQGLGDLVSDEWKHENLLQITDTTKMQKEMFKEQMKKAIFGAIIQNQQILQQAVGSIMGQQQPPPTTPPTQPDQSQLTPEQMAMMQGQGQQTPPDMSAMGNAEAMPMTDSMNPRNDGAEAQMGIKP